MTQLKQLSTVYHLSQLIIEPARITPISSTLIDVILTSDPSRIISSGVLHIGISYHSLVCAVRKFAIPSKNTHIYITTRSFKYFKAQAFRDELETMPWNSVQNLNTPDEMFDHWCDMFISVANKHAPIRNKRVRNKKSPWLSAELKKSMINRDKLKKQAVSSNDPLFWKKFKKERNRLNNEIKKAKADYYKSQVESNIGNPKAIWKCINQITHRKATNNSSINELKVNNKSFTEPSDISDILNRHFISIGPNLASALPIGDTDFESYITPARSVFRLKHTTADVVFKILKKLSPHKATGLDNISCRLLKEAAPIISVSLAMIINGSIVSGVFPSKWKIAKIFPLFKANDCTDPHNYRPISVLSTVSKVCERVVYDQLYAYLTENALLTKFQSGFRSSIPQLQLC